MSGLKRLTGQKQKAAAVAFWMVFQWAFLRIWESGSRAGEKRQAEVKDLLQQVIGKVGQLGTLTLLERDMRVQLVVL
jgi:hypothetical protein